MQNAKFWAMAITVAFIPSTVRAQDAGVIALAEAAQTARTKCLDDVVSKAKFKKVNPDTFKLILDGACQTEIVKARDTYSAVLDSAVPPGLSFDPEPNKMRGIRAYDANFEKYKATLVSKYALEN